VDSSKSPPPVTKRRRVGGASWTQVRKGIQARLWAGGRAFWTGANSAEVSEAASSSVTVCVPDTSDEGKGASGGRKRHQQSNNGEVEPVRLHVFWGYAGWSRCQLMGEIARGSWGLSRALSEDVTKIDPVKLWEEVYPRLIFAPKNDMSESYSGHAPEEEARRRELRRMAIFHELLRRN